MGELGELAHPWITVSIEIAILKIVIDLPFTSKYQKIAAIMLVRMGGLKREYLLIIMFVILFDRLFVFNTLLAVSFSNLLLLPLFLN